MFCFAQGYAVVIFVFCNFGLVLCVFDDDIMHLKDCCVINEKICAKSGISDMYTASGHVRQVKFTNTCAVVRIKKSTRRRFYMYKLNLKLSTP